MSKNARHVDPGREQFGAFMKSAGEGPIWMLNLIRLRKKARYRDEDGIAATGEEAYRTYAQESEPYFKGAGGRIVWSGTPEHMLIGPETEHWDLCFVAEYPSAQAFASMVKNEGYQKAARHRTAAVKDSRLLRLKPGAAGKVFG